MLLLPDRLTCEAASFLNLLWLGYSAVRRTLKTGNHGRDNPRNVPGDSISGRSPDADTWERWAASDSRPIPWHSQPAADASWLWTDRKARPEDADFPSIPDLTECHRP